MSTRSSSLSSSHPSDGPRHPLRILEQTVGEALDLWQPRDWPHRRGDLPIRLDLHTLPLPNGSPGRRSHACEHCNNPALVIHDNVLCWKCKSTFCLFCLLENPYDLQATKIDSIVKEGFAKCWTCQEPLRSIGLIDIMRGPIESVSNCSGAVDIGGGAVGFIEKLQMNHSKNSSLVAEAEDALKRARRYERNDKTNEAISEYTHAINAINYLASSSPGAQPTLRAHDILLIAHIERALLEGNRELAETVSRAYPKASVKHLSRKEIKWRLSESAFSSLFYQLPAKYMAGSDYQEGKGYLAIDLRNCTREQFIKDIADREDFKAHGLPLESFKEFMAIFPHCDGFEDNFNRMDGMWQGIYGHNPPIGIMPQLGIQLGSTTIKIVQLIQFVFVFPTNLQAQEYVRVRFIEGKIGEEESLNAQPSSELADQVKVSVRSLGATSVKKIRVLRAKIPVPVPSCVLSVVAAVGNVATKVCLSTLEEDPDNLVAAIAHMLLFLEQKLFKNRSQISEDAKESFSHGDLTMCAYCGSSGERLKSCSRCKLARYCSVDCQTKHWKMNTSHGHKNLCRQVAKG